MRLPKGNPIGVSDFANFNHNFALNEPKHQYLPLLSAHEGYCYNWRDLEAPRNAFTRGKKIKKSPLRAF